MLLPLLLACLAAVASGVGIRVGDKLPPPTSSEVCPAFSFDNDWSVDEGPLIIKFQPLSRTQKIAWVDVHAELFDKASGKPVPGTQTDVKMDNAGMGSYQAAITDQSLVGAAHSISSQLVVRYSFTYCVDIEGPVDCNTEVFVINPITFTRRQALIECPTQCGLQAEILSIPTTCLGSDGVLYPDAQCAGQPMPEPLYCPATPACVSFYWDPMPVRCPTECGFSATMVEPEVICMGTDGNTYGGSQCANLPRPGPVMCSGTEPCVTFTRRQALVECPTQCGLQAEILTVPTQCLGSDGVVYPDAQCAGQPMPEPLRCPATPACVSFYWEPMPVRCATECGFSATMVEPEVLCMGTDGNTYDGSQCANLPRPGPVMCSGTEPCVTFTRRQALVECPTQCGLQAEILTVPTQCLGSDDEIYSDAECAGQPQPKPIHCPATPACVSFYWEPMSVRCPTECGFQGTMVEPEVLCMGTDGNTYEGSECANLPRPPTVLCPATEPCVTFSWTAGLVECPYECGMSASVLTIPSACIDSLGRPTKDEQCEINEKPSRIQCPATAECPLVPLPKQCPMIEFDHGVSRIDKKEFLINFKPLGQGIERRKFDWIDLHVQLVDADNQEVPGTELVNYRMKDPADKSNYVFTHKLENWGAISKGYRMKYSFTYCIEMVDCDTPAFVFPGKV